MRNFAYQLQHLLLILMSVFPFLIYILLVIKMIHDVIQGLEFSDRFMID